MRSNNLLAAALLPLLLFHTPSASAQNASLVHRKRYAMGTVFEIVAYSNAPDRASSAIDQALDEVVRLDNLMSNYKPESDLSRMNREAHFRTVKIPADLYRVIEIALRYSRLSNGEFDVSIGPVVDLWKAALAGGAMPTAAQQAQARSCVDYQKIELTAPDQIQFHSDCLRIDLGAIGKGYAVDRALGILAAQGVERAYIDAGGSTIYGLGSPPDAAGWLVHLRDPSNRLDPQVHLLDNSVSTSEQTAASGLTGDAPGHIVTPATGKPVRTPYAVSVVAKTATDSDALSTTLLLLGPEKGTVLVAGLKDVSAIWVAADGHRTIALSGAAIAVRESGAPPIAATADSVASIEENNH